jgi:hypothetical protein
MELLEVEVLLLHLQMSQPVQLLQLTLAPSRALP